MGSSHRFFKSVVVAALAVAPLAGLGCSSELETGYEPRRLGAPAATRRGYYAPAYTPAAFEAAQAQADPNAGMSTVRKPGRAP